MSIVIGPTQLKLLEIIATAGCWIRTHDIVVALLGYFSNAKQIGFTPNLKKLHAKGFIDRKKEPAKDMRGCIRYLNYWKFVKFPEELSRVVI